MASPGTGENPEERAPTQVLLRKAPAVFVTPYRIDRRPVSGLWRLPEILPALIVPMHPTAQTIAGSTGLNADAIPVFPSRLPLFVCCVATVKPVRIHAGTAPLPNFRMPGSAVAGLQVSSGNKGVPPYSPLLYS